MKKIMFTGIMALSLGTMLFAEESTANRGIAEQTTVIEPENEPHMSGPYYDDQGTYYIFSSTDSCYKLYLPKEDPSRLEMEISD